MIGRSIEADGKNRRIKKGGGLCNRVGRGDSKRADRGHSNGVGDSRLETHAWRLTLGDSRLKQERAIEGASLDSSSDNKK